MGCWLWIIRKTVGGKYPWPISMCFFSIQLDSLRKNRRGTESGNPIFGPRPEPGSSTTIREPDIWAETRTWFIHNNQGAQYLGRDPNLVHPQQSGNPIFGPRPEPGSSTAINTKSNHSTFSGIHLERLWKNTKLDSTFQPRLEPEYLPNIN
jgi:hypothetical protein